MTPLRRRMIHDLQLRGYSERTIEAYVRPVAQLAQFYHTSPDRLSEEQVRHYLLHLSTVKKVARATHTIALCGIKFFYQQTLGREWQWVSDVAREKGLMVTAEGGDLPYNLSMIMDGQTGWEHPLSYIPLYSDVAKFFGQSEAVYSPTLVVGGPGPWNDEYFFQEYEVWKNPKLRRWMPWRQLFPHTRRRMLRPETDYSFPLLAQGLADIMAEGGHGAIGAHGQQHGIASHWEVWMAASAMGPMGALELASREGAYFLGVQQDIGSIAVGKLADLMVLNSNPLEDIHNTADIRYVMKSGVLYDADILDELWPQQREYGPRPWVDPAALRDDVRPINYWDRPRNR